MDEQLIHCGRCGESKPRDAFYDPTDEVPYFAFLGGASIVVGVALLVTRKAISRLMEGVR